MQGLPGVPSYAELSSRAQEVEILGVTLALCSLDDLKARMATASGTRAHGHRRLRSRPPPAAPARRAARVARGGAGIALALAIGIAAGRFAWGLFADGHGIVNEPLVPVAAIVAIVPATVAVALLSALLPARTAAHTSPASALRAE